MCRNRSASAGQQSAGYSRKVNCFNWISFFQNLGGRRFLAYMSAQLRGIYDYILIDSRTGVSDTSGICTVEMPDAVVVCFTLNEQSIRGAANVSESIVSQRNAPTMKQRKLQLKSGEAQPAAVSGLNRNQAKTKSQAADCACPDPKDFLTLFGRSKSG